MSDETKDILFKDLSMRLPYGVKRIKTLPEGISVNDLELSNMYSMFGDSEYKPILRPLSDLNDTLLIVLGYGEAGIKTLIEDIQQGEICQREYMLLIINHYDVSLLIERGIAVDVNTCETDPYK